VLLLREKRVCYSYKKKEERFHINQSKIFSSFFFFVQLNSFKTYLKSSTKRAHNNKRAKVSRTLLPRRRPLKSPLARSRLRESLFFSVLLLKEEEDLRNGVAR
jgi:hypothetical protein